MEAPRCKPSTLSMGTKASDYDTLDRSATTAGLVILSWGNLNSQTLVCIYLGFPQCCKQAASGFASMIQLFVLSRRESLWYLCLGQKIVHSVWFDQPSPKGPKVLTDLDKNLFGEISSAPCKVQNLTI